MLRITDRLGIFENKVLRKIFGSKSEGVRGALECDEIKE
jgi:hypothetical protein